MCSCMSAQNGLCELHIHRPAIFFLPCRHILLMEYEEDTILGSKRSWVQLKSTFEGPDLDGVVHASRQELLPMVGMKVLQAASLLAFVQGMGLA